MSKVPEQSFTKIQADTAVAQIVSHVRASFARVDDAGRQYFSISTESATEVAKMLELIKGQRGKSAVAAVPTVAGCRFAELDPVISGIATDLARRDVMDLVFQRDDYAATLEVWRASLATLTGESRAMIGKQIEEKQFELDATVKKLARYGDTLRAIDREAINLQVGRLNTAREQIENLAPMLDLAQTNAQKEAIMRMVAVYENDENVALARLELLKWDASEHALQEQEQVTTV